MSEECGHSGSQHEAMIIHRRDQVGAVVRDWVEGLPPRYRELLPAVAALAVHFMHDETVHDTNEPEVVALAAPLGYLHVELAATVAAAFAVACGNDQYVYFLDQHDRGATVPGFLVANLFPLPDVPDALLTLNAWVARHLDLSQVAILGDMISAHALALRFGADELTALLK